MPPWFSIKLTQVIWPHQIAWISYPGYRRIFLALLFVVFRSRQRFHPYDTLSGSSEGAGGQEKHLIRNLIRGLWIVSYVTSKSCVWHSTKKTGLNFILVLASVRHAFLVYKIIDLDLWKSWVKQIWYRQLHWRKVITNQWLTLFSGQGFTLCKPAEKTSHNHIYLFSMFNIVW